MSQRSIPVFLGVIVFGLLSTALVGTAHAQLTTWWVNQGNPNPPGDGSAGDPFVTIAEGITAASNGDQVRVLPGVYNENIDFGGKAITIHSTAGATETIIMGRAGHVVTFDNGETITSRLEGFKITNGSATLGGGIYCSGASPTIEYCWITANSAVQGGGIFCSESEARILRNAIKGNSAGSSAVNGEGGGIYSEESSLIIHENVIEYNQANGDDGGGSGGGIYCIAEYEVNSPEIYYNKIRFNEALIGAGGGIYIEWFDYDVANDKCIDSNWIAENEAETGGGGIYLTCPGNQEDREIVLVNNLFAKNKSSQTYAGAGGGVVVANSNIVAAVVHCTFAENIAVATGSEGGGIYCWGDATVAIYNCIFWHNEAPAYTYDQIYQYPNNVTVSYSDVEGGWTGTGNIDALPKWNIEDPDKYRPSYSQGSPCIDSGSNGLSLRSYDFEKEDRILPQDGTTDMGWDEVHYDT